MDFNRYVGIPWQLGGSDENEGLDCWSLCRLVLANHFGVKMDLLKGIAVPDGDRSGEFEAIAGYSDWSPVDGAPVPADVVFFHSMKTGRPFHIGLYIGKGLVLHSMAQGRRGVQIQRIGLLKPYFEKLVYYRNKNATDYSPA